MEIAVADELGLYLGCGEEMYGACLLAWWLGYVEIDIEELFFGCAVGKLFDILAELLNLLGGEPIDEALLYHSHCLGI